MKNNKTTTTIKTEFVFMGKDYKSNARAEAKILKLENDGYKLLSSNSKKQTYQK